MGERVHCRYVQEPAQKTQTPSEKEDENGIAFRFYSMQQAPGPRESPQVEAPAPQLGAALAV